MRNGEPAPSRQAPRRVAVLPPLRASRLLDQVRERARYLHFSLRTEQAYVYWIRAFVRYHGCRAHPSEMGAAEVEAFLTWLAAERGVAASTHGQALSALLFLYQRVLGLDLPWMQSIGRPRRQPRLPVVLSQDQVLRILERFDNAGDAHGLLARLLYGTGMRIAEGLRLRVKDVDFERRTLIVRCGKGGKDRALMLPAAVVAPLREQLAGFMQAKGVTGVQGTVRAAPLTLINGSEKLTLRFDCKPCEMHVVGKLKPAVAKNSVTPLSFYKTRPQS